MKELRVENLSKTYGIKSLLDQVDFSIRTGNRVGLIGANGAGKSSFLKILSGEDPYDSGEIIKPNDYTIRLLNQQPDLNEDDTLLQAIFASPSPLVKLVLRYEEVVTALQNHPEDERLLDQFNQVSEQMNVQNGWDLEVQAKTILHKMGLKDLQRKISACSGGERKRVGLAQVLISQSDLLILDEPTNHLDIESIRWLEDYLASYSGALLVVTHDRYFLERVTNKIVELRQGKFYEYTGNYSTYLTKKQEELDRLARMEEKQDRLFQQELAWMRKGAKARTTKQQARIQRFENLKDQVESRVSDQEALEMNFDQARIGNQIIEASDLSVQIGDHSVIQAFTKTFVKGDRLGIIGPNGVGKTTLLNAFAGLQPLAGGQLLVGQTVRLAYYRQLDEDLPGEMRVLNYLTQVADEFKVGTGHSISASQMLERFNFERSTHGMVISQLSGGERRRLYLLTLLIQEPNVLLLDEPTNDLDIQTLQVLEDYLLEFNGVVMIVSHDRYFLDKTVNQILQIQGNGSYQFDYGNYSEFQTKYPSAKSDAPSPAETTTRETKTTTSSKPTETATQPKRMTYQEKKEWDQLEEHILLLEEKIDTIKQEMVANGSDAGLLMDLQAELEETEAALLHGYERYDYLSELKR